MMVSNRSGDDERAGGMAAARAQRWLSLLNDRMGEATRQLFRSQLVLRAASEREIREQLRDLCTFASSICAPLPLKKAHYSAVRAAFRDVHAQWLSRSAIESGACGFFCHLLLRETVAHPEAAPLVVHLLLDPVLTPCCERESNARTQAVCEWRHKKPKYYAMACSTVWETLLPFLARAARQHRAAFANALNEFLDTCPRTLKARRVNCRFAQVAGFWRLLEAISERDPGDTSVELETQLLLFMIQWSVLCREREDDTAFDDLLMEKFYQDMQEVMFKCATATIIVRSAFRDLLEAFMMGSDSTAMTHAMKLRFAAFVAVGCFHVKGLASAIRSLILDHKHEWSTNSHSDAFRLVVSIVSHLDSFTSSTVFIVLDTLVSRYEDQKSSATDRRDLLLCIVYTIVCRQKAISECANDPQLVHFQERFLTEIEMEDMQLMPLHWMEVVWRVCFNMTASDADAFAEEARTFRLASAQLPDGPRPLVWEDLVKDFPFRQMHQFPTVLKLLGTNFDESLKLVEPTPVQRTDSLIEAALASKTGHKRRRLKRDIVVLSDEHEASRQNALLLPEVMERICSYMSAKRLCRMSLVCRAFAQVSRSDRLWRPLYMKLVQPLKTRCLHGSSYRHNWRSMFQAKHTAIRKLKSRQRAAAREAERDQDLHFVWHEDEHELRMRVTLASAQLCRECGCNQLFSSNETAKNHRMMHQNHRCPLPECRESLSSASALKAHMKAEHAPVTERKKAKTQVEKKIKDPSEAKGDAGETQTSVEAKKAFQCAVEGCTKVYKSEKWLQNHMKREHETRRVV